ncbi:MAG: VOC family protein [Tepidiformaceae bacterium]
MTSVEYLAMRPNLAVRDVAASVTFYRDVVGLELEHAFDDGSFALLRRGGAELALVHEDSPQPQGAYLYVTGVKTLHARCAERGVPILAQLTLEPWGLLDFVVEDPDGHRIAIGERVGRSS